MIKVGDKVRILPSAISVWVDELSIGHVCEVVDICGPNDILVKDGNRQWGLGCEHWEPYIKKDEQLVFDFMKE